MTDVIERSLTNAAKRLPASGDDFPEFSSAAAAEGLVDVAYAIEDSPVGRLLLASTKRGLVRLIWVSEAGQPEDATMARDLDDALYELSARVSPRVLEAPAQLDEVRRELDEYFEGRRRRFEVPIDWSLTQGFRRKVLTTLKRRIAYGDTTSYAEIAAMSGSPRAFRAAGTALGTNPVAIVVPCHRVLASGGGLGGYGGGLDRKRLLLELEGALD
jgi:methylated-DNA-[protein]-cysteine S-methyltransferase